MFFIVRPRWLPSTLCWVLERNYPRPLFFCSFFVQTRGLPQFFCRVLKITLRPSYFFYFFCRCAHAGCRNFSVGSLLRDYLRPPMPSEPSEDPEAQGSHTSVGEGAGAAGAAGVLLRLLLLFYCCVCCCFTELQGVQGKRRRKTQ